MLKAIHWIIDHMPKPIQKLWYSHESVWMYILVGGLTTIVSLIFQMLPTALFTRMHMANWLNTGLSTTISWIFAVTFAFFTNKKYVFQSVTDTRAAETQSSLFAAGRFAGGAAGRLRGKDRSLCPPGWPPGTEIDPAGFHARHRGDLRAVHP